MAAWTPWRRLSVGDFTARGLKFRLRLSTAAANVTPLVTALAVSVDMPDRIIAASDLVSGTGPLAVAFVPPFRGLSGIASRLTG